MLVKKVPAPPLLLAQKWDGNKDVTGWWVSEKLDGVRAFWNGKEFISRLGNAFYAPDFFSQGLPSNVQLDGELFAGRKQFQSTVGIVKSQDMGNAWKKINLSSF